jgi:hypothetical protein
VIWTGLGRTPNFRTDVPRVVVEFVSEGRRNWQRDYVVKREEYQELGVGEYWIIDRFSRTMTGPPGCRSSTGGVGYPPVIRRGRVGGVGRILMSDRGGVSGCGGLSFCGDMPAGYRRLNKYA